MAGEELRKGCSIPATTCSARLRCIRVVLLSLVAHARRKATSSVEQTSTFTMLFIANMFTLKSRDQLLLQLDLLSPKLTGSSRKEQLKPSAVTASHSGRYNLPALP